MEDDLWCGGWTGGSTCGQTPAVNQVRDDSLNQKRSTEIGEREQEGENGGGGVARTWRWVARKGTGEEGVVDECQDSSYSITGCRW